MSTSITIDPAKLSIFTRFLNLCENDSGSPETDYRTIYLYADGKNKRRQVTLGRGFTQDGGNLWKVLDRYIQKGGARADFFRPYKQKMSNGNLWQDKPFLKTLGECAAEQEMKDAQDEIFNEVYLKPALDWCSREGFQLILSNCVAVDSYLHSGQMSPHLRNKFPEPTPANGGDEKTWITKYLEARLDWFRRATGPLNTCTFRPAFFLGEVEKDNWDLNCPLYVKGKGRICS